MKTRIFEFMTWFNEITPSVYLVGYYLISDWQERKEWKIVGGWIGLGVLVVSLGVNSGYLIINIWREAYLKFFKQSSKRHSLP